ncbi:YeeE/YedE family protein [Pseudovibrio exalbescens]|uniref:YeeE/YedE family protein n=1 Tax=Pseudovibrio exalbescens TaxID=197461 RepID=UPI0023667190|nr:YeeE/YedE family protein [Pseudovibrio exalbescens]MDD7910895.1 YeeE/YedE family protein [Pseudovibrio exalbescens]
METSFTPLASLAGGILIGLSAVLLYAGLGRIAGISGIVSRLLPPSGSANERGWEVTFVIGLIAAPVLFQLLSGGPIQQTFTAGLPLLAIAGVLVGFGSVYGNGCTSGHGVCGISRLSVRSIAATLTFMATGFITVFVLRHLVGG